MTATVHIVDDDQFLRKALARLCQSAGFAVVEHASAEGLAGVAGADRPACILLDIRLANENGLAVQDTLRDNGSTVPVVFLTGYGTIPVTVRAMRGGAVEFLTKPVDEDVLLEAVNRALVVDAATLNSEQALRAVRDRFSTLTERERETMGLAIGGLMNKQIAGELGVSEITAKVHKRRVMEKMGASTLPDLVRLAEQLGLAARRSRWADTGRDPTPVCRPSQ